MQNLKTVDFGVAFTLTRPAPADYEDKDGNTQTAAANEPRFNYSNGVAQGLLLDASRSETAAIDDVPAFNVSAGHWIIDAEFYNSEPLKGMGLDERFSGSGKMVVSYSGGTAKVWAGGQVIYTVGSYTPVEPTHICEGGLATIADMIYKPMAISDADAAALATGDFEIYVPFTPSQLFSEGQQGAWYDPSDLATLFQDAAGTVPVTADGDPVGLMLDKSGNGNHASQSTTAAKPAYRTDGTLHWLEFDGVDDCLVSSNPYSIGSYAGAQTIEADSGRVLSLNIHDIRYYSGIVSGVLYSLVDGDTSTWATTPLAASTTPFVQFSYADNGLATSYLNGEPFDTQPTEPLLVGDRTYVLGAARNAANRSNFLTGNVYGIITNSERPSSGQRQDIENYLAAKAGVTL